MIYRIVWFDEAVEELEEIYDFYYAKNSHVANDIYHSILNGVEKYLRYTPQIAAIEPEDENELLRSLIVYNGLFKIIFLIEEETIVITQIWCCRKNPISIRK